MGSALENESLAASAPFHRHLSASERRKGAALLNQQCWLWGQDVKRAQRNLLVKYGFERLRPPEGRTGSTQYTLKLPNRMVVQLWGFGLYYGDTMSGLHLNRFAFEPRAARYSPQWHPAESMRLERSNNVETLCAALLWIGEYESWVLRTCGVAYRTHCLACWRNATSPKRIAAEWYELASALTKAQAPSSIPQRLPGSTHLSGDLDRTATCMQHNCRR